MINKIYVIWTIITIALLPVAAYVSYKRTTKRFTPLLVWVALFTAMPMASASLKWAAYLFPSTYGYVEGKLDMDLTFPQVGRCRLDNPRATIRAGGDRLVIGYTNYRRLDGKERWMPHIWGIGPNKEIVDLTRFKSAPKRVIAEVEVRQGEIVIISQTANDKDRQVLVQGIPQVRGILKAQGLF